MIRFLFSLIILFLYSQVYGQGTLCGQAAPFCTGTTVTFPANFTGTGPGNGPQGQPGPDYGCLSSQPNPTWYYMKIDQSGNLTITINNSSNVDVDFICWGPFNSQTNPCVSLLTANKIEDCSFSAAAVETVNITGAVAGEFYLLMITNYDNVATNISFTKTGGNATTDCDVLKCFFDSVVPAATACDPTTNQFDLNYSIYFNTPPNTGNLIVKYGPNDSTIHSAPFTSPLTGTISGLDSDGTTRDFFAYFTNIPDSCFSDTVQFTAPASCVCSYPGTYNANIIGNGQNNYVLCYGDSISLSHNGDDFHGNANGPMPDAVFAIYTCPPTSDNPLNDPCFWKLTSDTTTFKDINNYDQSNSLINQAIADGHVVNNNTLYFNVVSVSDFNNLTIDPSCVDTGMHIAVTYLDTVVVTSQNDCQNGIITYTFNGGIAPYSITNSGVGTLTNNNIPNMGGSVDVTNLSSGDIPILNIVDANGCSYQYTSPAFIDKSDPAFTAPALLCINSGSMQLQAVTPGGEWIGNGMSTNGMFNPAVAGIGTHTIQYGISGPCGDTSSFDITVTDIPAVTFSLDTNLGCEPLTITATYNGVLNSLNNYAWSFIPGDTIKTTDPFVTYTFTNAGTYSIYFSIDRGCFNDTNARNAINVNPIPQADFDINPSVVNWYSPNATFTNQTIGATGIEWRIDRFQNISKQDVISYQFPYLNDTNREICLYAVNEHECFDTICKTLIIEGEPLYYIPNVFTPNGNGNNDVFKPSIYNTEGILYNFVVYNRWGEEIFTTSDVNQGWDGNNKNGNKAPAGGYVFSIEIEGETTRRVTKYGHFILLR